MDRPLGRTAAPPTARHQPTCPERLGLARSRARRPALTVWSDRPSSGRRRPAARGHGQPELETVREQPDWPRRDTPQPGRGHGAGQNPHAPAAPPSRGPVGAATTTNTTATAAGTSASGPGARVCSGGAAAGAGREGHAASPGTSAGPRARPRARAASRARGHRLRRAPSGHVHPGPAGGVACRHAPRGPVMTNTGTSRADPREPRPWQQHAASTGTATTVRRSTTSVPEQASRSGPSPSTSAARRRWRRRWWTRASARCSASARRAPTPAGPSTT